MDLMGFLFSFWKKEGELVFVEIGSKGSISSVGIFFNLGKE